MTNNSSATVASKVLEIRNNDPKNWSGFRRYFQGILHEHIVFDSLKKSILTSFGYHA